MSTPLVFGPDGIDDEQIVGKPPPSTRFLNWLHTRVSTNRPEDTHHRLGYGPTEAAPGNHTHDGRDSLPISGVADLTAQVTALEAIALANLNRIINGDFRVNQRAAVPGTFTNVYLLDRWRTTSTASDLSWTGDNISGRVVTVASGSVRQVVERTNIPAGEYTLAWEGTAQAVIFTTGDTAPSFADSPIAFTSAGTADVQVVFAAGTVSKVRLLPGSTDYPFIPRMIGEELALCQRYYTRFQASANFQRIAWGAQSDATHAHAVVALPAVMRATPTISFTALAWTDHVGFNSAISSVAATFALPGPSNNFGLLVTFGAAGAAFRPGAMAATGATSFLAFDAEL